MTYREVDVAANRLAHALAEAGVQRGDRVTVLLENSAEAVVAIFGALKIGAAFMVLHPSTKPDKLALLLDDAAPCALVTQSTLVQGALDVIAASSVACVVWADDRPLPIQGRARSICWHELASCPAERPFCPAIDLDLAALIYTSGSTGQPKGVMVAHANMWSVASSINTYLMSAADDVILNVLPLAFGYGLYQIMLAFQVGARVILEKSFAYPAHVISLARQEGVTGLPGVPTLFALLLKYPDLLQRELPSLRYLTNAGAALHPSHILQLRSAFPWARLYSMYGQTECQRVCYLPPEEVDRRPASVGIAIPNTEVYIVGDDGRRLPAGEIGELVVRGSHVTRGYWRAPELTAERFRPGPFSGEMVLYTGDLFRMDEDGFLYFVARKDDVIKSRGEKVSPREVEAAVCELSGVAEAAVVGVPDPLLGQAILLVIVPREDVPITERDIRAHCARTLEDFMLPKHVRIVAELPRTANGKVDKQQLGREFSLCVA